MAKLVTVSASQWGAMAAALSQAFSSRQLMVWSRDHAVESTLARRGWDGALPATQGDFFANGEFEYASKNGRGIKRTIDDQVVIRTDGSARITTTITYTNTQPPGPANGASSFFYVTLYGPAGAKVDESVSDPTASREPTIARHPATGWFVAVPPDETSTLKVTWDAPAVASHNADGSWTYRLRWLHVVDNTGDVLDLHVQLPGGARWQGAAPPTTTPLVHDLNGTWRYNRTPGGQ